MSITLELPAPLGEELAEEAEKTGVSAQDHATILLYLATALLNEEQPTPFRDEVRLFLAANALDADRIAAALENLVALCAKAGPAVVPGEEAPRAFHALKQWRNRLVHQPARWPRPAEVERRSALGKYAHVPGTSEDFAREKQLEVERENRERA